MLPRGVDSKSDRVVECSVMGNTSASSETRSEYEIRWKPVSSVRARGVVAWAGVVLQMNRQRRVSPSPVTLSRPASSAAPKASTRSSSVDAKRGRAKAVAPPQPPATSGSASGSSSVEAGSLKWQHPFVDVFRSFNVADWSIAERCGDVVTTLVRGRVKAAGRVYPRGGRRNRRDTIFEFLAAVSVEVVVPSHPPPSPL